MLKFYLTLKKKNTTLIQENFSCKFRIHNLELQMYFYIIKVFALSLSEKNEIKKKKTCKIVEYEKKKVFHVIIYQWTAIQGSLFFLCTVETR